MILNYSIKEKEKMSVPRVGGGDPRNKPFKAV